MCTLVLLRRPEHPWPVVVAANRDEMRARPWRPPARHWPDRPEVTAGLDTLAGGTWLGLNDHGVVAAILNRTGTLGPQVGKRSRGELVLEALDHADAAAAARALAALEPTAYRPFNMVVADNHDAFWLRHTGTRIVVSPLPPGLSMLTAGELNDAADPRVAAFLPRFAAAPAPAPDRDDWAAWEALLTTAAPPGAAPEAGLAFQRDDGFGTVCGSTLALPAVDRAGVRPVWRFCADPQAAAPFLPVSLG